jgi:hypothetical protein
LKPPTFLAGIKFLWRIEILWRSSPAPEPCSKASKHAADSSPETSGLGAGSPREPCGGRIEVHHIVGVRQGGAPLDLSNCACLSGYTTKTSSTDGSSSPT